MTANPNRSMLQYEEKLRNETRGLQKWQNKYHTEKPVPIPDLKTASVSICVLGHPLNPDGSCSDILLRRLERAYENWRLSQSSTVMIVCGVDESMFPRADPVTKVMQQVLHDEYGVPVEQVFCQPDGQTLMEMSKSVSKMLSGTCPAERSPIGVIKLITSDFNIVRARRCFSYAMKIYVSDDEVPSGLGAEDMMYLLDEEHRITREYRMQGCFDADKR